MENNLISSRVYKFLLPGGQLKRQGCVDRPQHKQELALDDKIGRLQHTDFVGSHICNIQPELLQECSPELSENQYGKLNWCQLSRFEFTYKCYKAAHTLVELNNIILL